MPPSFIASPTAPAPVPAPADTAVVNDGWWPDMDTAAARDAARIDSAVTEARLADILANAMLWANGQFAAWRLIQEAAGYESLADVPAPTIAGGSRQVFLYRRAVFAAMKAEADEGYRVPDTRFTGDVRGEALVPTINAFHRNAFWAVRDFLGLPRVTVELI